jgi:hypothetical protein
MEQILLNKHFLSDFRTLQFAQIPGRGLFDQVSCSALHVVCTDQRLVPSSEGIDKAEGVFNIIERSVH